MPFYYLTLLLIPLATHPVIGYNFHGFTPVKVAGALAFSWAILSLNNSQARVYFRSRSKKYFGLFVAFLCLSMAVNGFDIGIDRIFWLVSILMFYVATMTLVNTRERLLASCVVLLIAMDISSAYMMRQYLQYGSLYQNFRPGGSFGDSNYYSASALAALPIAYFLGKQSTSKLLSLFCLGSVGAILLGLGLGQSRGGMIGLAAVVLMVIYESSARIRTVTFLCVLAILVVAFSPINPIRRLIEPDIGAKRSTNVHIALTYAGLGMVRDHPFVGVGLGRFKSYSMAFSNDMRVPKMAHNSFLELAAEGGIPTLILFLLMCLAVMKDISNAKYLHAEDPVTNSILTGMRVGMIGFLTAAMFFSAEYQKAFWLLCFLVMATTQLEPKIEHMEDLDDLESAWEESEHAGLLTDPQFACGRS